MAGEEMGMSLRHNSYNLVCTNIRGTKSGEATSAVR